MDVYTTEEEQVEALKRWWLENGKSAILGVVLGLAAIFGWRGWQGHVVSQSETASGIYDAALNALSQNNLDEARSRAREIVSGYEDTGYALFAHMLLAKLAADEGDYTAAEDHLVSARGQVDNITLQHEVTLRLARVYLASGRYGDALALLEDTDTGSFSARYQELKGDIHVAEGNVAAARSAYQQAITDSLASSYDTSLLKLKLDSLGD